MAKPVTTIPEQIANLKNDPDTTDAPKAETAPEAQSTDAVQHKGFKFGHLWEIHHAIEEKEGKVIKSAPSFRDGTFEGSVNSVAQTLRKVEWVGTNWTEAKVEALKIEAIKVLDHMADRVKKGEKFVEFVAVIPDFAMEVECKGQEPSPPFKFTARFSDYAQRMVGGFLVSICRGITRVVNDAAAGKKGAVARDLQASAFSRLLHGTYKARKGEIVAFQTKAELSPLVIQSRALVLTDMQTYPEELKEVINAHKAAKTQRLKNAVLDRARLMNPEFDARAKVILDSPKVAKKVFKF